VAGLTLNADWSINSWVILSGLILRQTRDRGIVGSA
jgi:hypothetical protein